MIEQNPLENTRLETEFRNPLQVEVIRLLIAHNYVKDADEWLLNHSEPQGKYMSDIIDSPKNENIRAMARVGTPEKYREAAEIVERELIAILQSEGLKAAA